MSLHHYRTLGKSGLAVSPFGLGTMTFGMSRWGTDHATSRAVFDEYVNAGGNFIDTANVYSSGRSEEMVGEFMSESQSRDSLVIATKAGFASGSGPHIGGNGAKHVHASLDASLRRLRTDYIDLYWNHVWDGVTPAEELLNTMAGLVRDGKIRYWGMSNSPAWFIAKVATLAQVRGLPGPIALQYSYSLANRDIENEFVPLAFEFGMGIIPWSPLAFGLLTGNYDRATVEAAGPRAGGLPKGVAAIGEVRPHGDKRLDGANPFGDTLFTDRNWKLVDALKAVARDVGQTPAAIAYAWVNSRPGVTATLLGVSKTAQLKANVAALDIVLTPEQYGALDAASAIEQSTIYSLFSQQARQSVVFGGSTVRGWLA